MHQHRVNFSLNKSHQSPSKKSETKQYESLVHSQGDPHWHSYESIHDSVSYDLSKYIESYLSSMIRKFPGKQTFMGNNLDIVCLLQAVQIERLTNALNEYFVKCKEVDKMPLDRRSYEIQITELTELINNSKLQMNQKNMAVEMLKKSWEEMYTSLENKYQKALFSIDQLLKANTKLESQIDMLQNNNRKLSLSRDQMGQSIRELHNLSLEKSEMEIELKRIQDSLVIVAKEKETFRNRSQQLSWRLNQMENIQKTNIEYQNKLVLISQEVERLTRVVRQKNQEKIQLTQNNTQLENQNRKLTNQLIEINHQLQNQRINQKNHEETIQDRNHRMQALMERNKQYQKLVNSLRQEVKTKVSDSQSVSQSMNELRKALQQKNIQQEIFHKQLQNIERQRQESKNQFQQRHRTMLQEKQNLTRHYEQQIVALTDSLKNLEIQKQINIQQKEGTINKLHIEKEELMRSLRSAQDSHSRLESVIKQKIHQLKYEREEKDKMGRRISSMNLQAQTANRKTFDLTNSRTSIQQELNRLTNENKNLKDTEQRQKTQIGIMRQYSEGLQLQKNNLQVAIQQIKQGFSRKESQFQKQLQSILTQRQSTAKQLESAQLYIRQIQEIGRENESIKVILMEKSDKILELEKEVDNVRHSQMKSTQQTKNMESKVTMLAHELERFQVLLKNKQQQTKRLSEILENTREVHSSLAIQFKILQHRSQDLNQKNQQLEHQIKTSEQAREHFARIKTELNLKGQQNREFKEQIVLSHKKIELMHTLISETIKMLQKLSEDQSSRFQVWDGEFKFIKEQLIRVRRQNSTGVQIIKSHSEQLIGNVIETTRNNRILQEKYNRKIQQLQNVLAFSDEETKKLKSTILSYQSKLILLNQTVVGKERELQYCSQREVQMKQKLEVCIQEIKQCKLKNQDLLSQLRNAQELNKNYMPHKHSLLNKISQLESINKSLRDELVIRQRQKQSLIEQIKLIESAISEKEKVIQQVSTRMQQDNRRTEEEFQELTREKNRLASRNTYLGNQYNNAVKTYQKRITDLESQCEKATQQLHQQNDTIYQNQESLRNQRKLYESKISSIKTEAKTEIEQKYAISGRKIIELQEKVSDLQEEIKEQFSLIKARDNEIKMYQLNQRQTTEYSDKEIINLRIQVDKGQQQNRDLQRQVSMMVSQVQESKKQLTKMRKSFEDQLEHLQIINNRLQQYEEYSNMYQIEREKNFQYQELINVQEQTIRNLEIEIELLNKESLKGRSVYQNCEMKVQSLTREFQNYETVIQRIKHQNYQLKNYNYDINLQLKKTETFKRKVDILNKEIDRLSQNNEQLYEEVSSCKLVIGSQSSLERRINEHYALFPLLFCEIQALRNRVIEQEDQLKKMHRESLPRA